VILQLNKRNEDGTIDAVSYKYLENFQFTSRGGITQEGDKGIIENAMATWGNTKNIKVG
jgi:hypothetical protein